jgi:hypothetical protein
MYGENLHKLKEWILKLVQYNGTFQNGVLTFGTISLLGGSDFVASIMQRRTLYKGFFIGGVILSEIHTD